jgi:DNA-binding CsgD family transcriptional regulator
MEDRTSHSQIQEQQAKALLLFIVVVGYFLTFIIASSNGIRYKLPELLIGLAFGMVFVILGVFEEEIFRNFGPWARNAVYFTIQICLVFGIGWTLGPGGNWLMGVPLAGMAMMRLRPGWRWLVYGGVMGAGILPIGLRYSTWGAAWMNAMIIAAALFFAVVLSQFRLNDQAARERAERLVERLEAANRKLVETLHPAAKGEAILEEPLSEREIEVLRLVVAGMSNREIAERLVISPGTAKTHIHHLCGKLGVRNRTEAAMKARDLQLV